MDVDNHQVLVAGNPARRTISNNPPHKENTRMAVTEWDETHLANTHTSSKPTVIDMWAPWCGPCQQFGPIFEAVATELSDKYTFAKVNVDDAPKIAQRFGVMSIPTVIVLSTSGDVIANWVGARSSTQLREALNQLA